MLAIFTHVCQHCHIWNAKKPYNWDFSLKPLAFLRVSPYAPKRKFVGSNPARDAKKAYKLYVYGLFYCPFRPNIHPTFTTREWYISTNHETTIVLLLDYQKLRSPHFSLHLIITLSIYTHLTKFKEDQAVYALNEHLDEMIETRQFLTTIQ